MNGPDQLITQITEILLGIVQQPLAPQSHIYWLYLLSTASIALVLYCLRDRVAGCVSIRKFFAYLFPTRVYLHRSTLNDLLLVFANTLLYTLFLVPLVMSTAHVSQWVWLQLHQTFGPVQQPLQGSWATFSMTVAILLAADLAFYCSHWLAHKVPLLWEFHKVHHSAEVLTPLTVFRRHPVEMIVDGSVSGIMVGVTYGVFDYLSGGTLDTCNLLGVNAGVFVFLLVGFNLQHSHIWFSYGRKLNHVFISPALHQIHHSKDPRHFDRNMGNVFAIWDWLFGTLYVPAQREHLAFGLARDEEIEFRSFISLYWRPLQGTTTRLVNATRGLCGTARSITGRYRQQPL